MLEPESMSSGRLYPVKPPARLRIISPTAPNHGIRRAPLNNPPKNIRARSPRTAAFNSTDAQ
jgi:hypothetical protein